MSRKIIGGRKDDNGIFIKEEPVLPPTPAPEPAADIDDLMKAGLQAIKGTMRAIMSDVNTGMPSRETVMNLRDVMSMLRELKKEERDLLDNMTSEQLAEALKK